MKNWSVLSRIVFSFALLSAVMLGRSIATHINLSAMQQQVKEIRDATSSGMNLASVVRATWTTHLMQTQQMLLSLKAGPPGAESEERKAQALEQIASQQHKVKDVIARYKDAFDGAEDRQQYENLLQLHQAYLAIHAQVMQLMRAREIDQAQQLAGGKLVTAWEKGRRFVTQRTDRDKTFVDQRLDLIISDVRAMLRNMLLASVLTLALAVACGFLLIRAVTRPIAKIVQSLRLMSAGDLNVRLDLQRGDEFQAIEIGFNKMTGELKQLVGQAQRSSVQISAAINEIAATSKQQQATATETAATTSEIGATSREIATTARDLVRAMGHVSQSAEQTSVLAGSGQLGLERMTDVMHQVLAAAEVVNGKLAVLNEKAGNINQVVTTIIKVADQTNLLSLNAAIEAEKAGEYGRGFSVVATEVRRLADQTAVATYDIDQMVREMQSAVSAGVMGMDKFSDEVRRSNAEVAQVGDQLSQIIQQVQRLAPEVQSVNDGIKAQSAGAEQINQALIQLSEATGQTTESLRQSGNSVDELNQVAAGLRAGVGSFVV